MFTGSDNEFWILFLLITNMKCSMCDFVDVHLIQKGIPNFNFGTVACVILQTIVVWDRQKLKNVRNKKENDVHLIQKWIPNFNFGTVRSMCDLQKIATWKLKNLKNVRNNKENDVHLIQKWNPNFNFLTMNSEICFDFKY